MHIGPLQREARIYDDPQNHDSSDGQGGGDGLGRSCGGPEDGRHGQHGHEVEQEEDEELGRFPA